MARQARERFILIHAAYQEREVSVDGHVRET